MRGNSSLSLVIVFFFYVKAETYEFYESVTKL